MKLSPSRAMFVLASIVVSFLAASSAPTPLYPLYQNRLGFTAITTTVIFGVYAVAVLAALLTLGRLSDHVGRRPVLLAAIAVQAMAMVVFATADSTAALLVARVVQGLSTGAAVAAVGAGMLDIDRTRGAVANSVAPGIGRAIAGAGFASGFQGGIRLVMALAQAHERAGVLSLLYVVSYLGMGIPAVVGGALVVASGGLLVTAREYGVAVIVLATIALVGLLLPESRTMQREEVCLAG